MATLFQAQKLSKSFGTKVLFENLDLNINEGEKIALIAPNGTGKSSLLRIIAGLDSPDTNSTGERGTVQIFSPGGVAFLQQEPVFNPDNTIFQEVFSGDHEVATIISEYESSLVSGNQKRIEAAISQMDRISGWQYDQQIKQILTSLKIEGLTQKMGQLSGGEKKRVALAKIIINQAGLVLMDEPTNHLDLDSIEYLEDYLSRNRMTFLMVTHDRYFLDRVCNRIIELDGGNLYNYDGNYSYFLKKREERLENLNTETEKARNLFRTELEWMRRMPSARTTKAKYRVKAFYDIKERSKQTIIKDNIKIDAAISRLGSKIINCKELSHSYSELVTLDGFTYNFAKGEKVGLVGPNGVGKTTFLEILTGNILPASGEIELGETVVFGYYRQNGIDFDPEDTVIDALRKIAEIVTLSDGAVIDVSQFLTRFLFPHSMHNTKISKLSGGEKRRLYLVTVLMKNPNFLILDEPTNDLDIMTLNVLEEYLESFKGCVIIVSHDRYFLDKIAGHLFVFEGNGVIKDFVGKYSEYREMLKEEVTSRAVKREKEEPVKVSRERKLSYKEKKELEAIETKLESLSVIKKELEAALGSGTLSPESLVSKSEELSGILKKTESLEHRWLELSDI